MTEEIFQTIRQICSAYGVSVDDVLSRSRKRELCHVRIIIAYIIRNKYRLSYYETGKFINRDHSTITYYVKIYDDLCKYDFSFRDMVAKINDIVSNIKTEFQKELEDEFSSLVEYNTV